MKTVLKTESGVFRIICFFHFFVCLFIFCFHYDRSLLIIPSTTCRMFHLFRYFFFSLFIDHSRTKMYNLINTSFLILCCILEPINVCHNAISEDFFYD